MGPFIGERLRADSAVGRWANRRMINNAISKVQPPRPYRLSTKADYTSVGVADRPVL